MADPNKRKRLWRKSEKKQAPIIPAFEHPCDPQRRTHESSSSSSWSVSDDSSSSSNATRTPLLSPDKLQNIPPPAALEGHQLSSFDDPERYAEELQEQELIELAMEMSLHDSISTSPCSSSSSSHHLSSSSHHISSTLLPTPLLEETESERLDRLEREILEQVLQASQTDF